MEPPFSSWLATPLVRDFTTRLLLMPEARAFLPSAGKVIADCQRPRFICSWPAPCFSSDVFAPQARRRRL